jgi:hypothetical protein
VIRTPPTWASLARPEGDANGAPHPDASAYAKKFPKAVVNVDGY